MSTTETMWCLVANTSHQTKHFRGGAKLYLAPPMWGDGYQSIKCFGQSKGGRVIKIVLSWKHMTNFRALLVHSPAVIARLKEHYWMWEEDEAKKTAEVMNTRVVDLSSSAEGASK